MDARNHGITHNVEQTEKMIPFITSETAFRQNVSEVAFVIDLNDFVFWVQVNSVKWPVERNSVVSGHVSHNRTYRRPSDSLFRVTVAPLRKFSVIERYKYLMSTSLDSPDIQTVSVGLGTRFSLECSQTRAST